MQLWIGYNTQIIDVISISKDSHERICNKILRDKKVTNDELTFGEILNKELEKQNIRQVDDGGNNN